MYLIEYGVIIVKDRIRANKFLYVVINNDNEDVLVRAHYNSFNNKRIKEYVNEYRIRGYNVSIKIMSIGEYKKYARYLLAR